MKIKIIAEAAQGYEGNFTYAKMLIKAAAAAKADAVKFQLVYADELCTPEYAYYPLFKSLELLDSQWRELRKFSIENNINLEFDIFGVKSLNLCQKLKINSIKLHPTDIINYGLLKKVNKSKIKDICLGVGGSSLKEIDKALKILIDKEVTVMIGFQNYPTPLKTNQINRISVLKNELCDKYKNLKLGFADHEVSKSIIKYTLPAVAIGAGAEVIEKHFTLSNLLELEDSETALNPEELRVFCDLMRQSASSLGKLSRHDNFEMSPQEHNYRNTIRRHVIAAKNLKKGKIIAENDILLKRSSSKKPIKDLAMVIGSKINKNIRLNQPITLKDLEKK